MPASALQAIVFDWHGVLDETTYRGFSHFLAGLTGFPQEDIRRVISSRERQYVAGTLPPKDFWSFLQQSLRLQDGPLADARDHLLAVRLHRPLWNMIPFLAERFRLAILSDCPEDKLSCIRAQADLSPFTVARFSCERGFGKDDERFFLELCAPLNCDPPACLYVDDTERHITTAGQLRYRTCLFRTMEDLARCLQEEVP